MSLFRRSDRRREEGRIEREIPASSRESTQIRGKSPYVYPHPMAARVNTWYATVSEC